MPLRGFKYPPYIRIQPGGLAWGTLLFLGIPAGTDCGEMTLTPYYIRYGERLFGNKMTCEGADAL